MLLRSYRGLGSACRALVTSSMSNVVVERPYVSSPPAASDMLKFKQKRFQPRAQAHPFLFTFLVFPPLIFMLRPCSGTR